MIKRALMLSSALVASGQADAYQTFGKASWYGPGFHGRKTASGERFDKYAYTAAHKTLPLHSRVTVTNLANHESVVVRINDRGPYVRGRVIDLSQAAARAIGIRGTGQVAISEIDEP